MFAEIFWAAHMGEIVTRPDFCIKRISLLTSTMEPHYIHDIRWSSSGIACRGDLTHWGRVTHICLSKFTIIGSDNGSSPGRRQAIIWTNAWILLIWPLGTKFSEIIIKLHTFSYMKMHLKLSSAEWRWFRLGLHDLINTTGGTCAVWCCLLTNCLLYGGPLYVNAWLSRPSSRCSRSLPWSHRMIVILCSHHSIHFFLLK